MKPIKNTAASINGGVLARIRVVSDETLKQALYAVSRFVENTNDVAHMQSFITCVKELGNTLNLAGFYGAAFIAEEMGNLAVSILSGEIKNKDIACKVLIGTLSHMPAYMKHILSLGEDNPLVLLKALNNMRAVRGGRLITEALIPDSLLYYSGMDGAVDIDDRINIDENDLAAIQLQIGHYQAGIDCWMRNYPDRQGLVEMYSATESLAHIPSLSSKFQLLWIIGALINALIDGNLESNFVMQKLLKDAGLRIKKYSTGIVEKADRDEDNLLKNALYYIATVVSPNEKLLEIKKAFELDKYFIDLSDSLSDSSRKSGNSNNDIIINGGLKKKVVDGVEQTFKKIHYLISSLDTEQDSSAYINEIELLVTGLMDTLTVMGLGASRSSLHDLATFLHDIKLGRTLLNNASINQLNTSLTSAVWVLSKHGLSLSHLSTFKLKSNLADKTKSPEPDNNHAKLSVSESLQTKAKIPSITGTSGVRKLYSPVLKELIVELSSIRHDVDSSLFLRKPDRLKDAQRRVRLVRGCLLMISHERLANVLDTCDESIGHYLQMFNSNIVELNNYNKDELELLLDIVSGIQGYLEIEGDDRDDHPMTVNDIQAKSLHLRECIQQRDVVSVSTEKPNPDVLELGATDQNIDEIVNDQRDLEPISSRDLLNRDIVKHYLDEAIKSIVDGRKSLEKWINSPTDKSGSESFQRCLHVIQHGALNAGVQEPVELCHNIESLVAVLTNNSINNDAFVDGSHTLALVKESFENLAELIHQLKLHQASIFSVEDIVQRIHDQLNGLNENLATNKVSNGQNTPQHNSDSEPTKKIQDNYIHSANIRVRENYYAKAVTSNSDLSSRCQALMIQAGNEDYAIPVVNIDALIYVLNAKLERISSEECSRYEYNGNIYEYRSLCSILGVEQHQQFDQSSQIPIVLFHEGDKRVAIQVDIIVGSCEINIMPPGSQLSTVKIISGATMLGDGRVVLVLELGALSEVPQ